MPVFPSNPGRSSRAAQGPLLSVVPGVSTGPFAGLRPDAASSLSAASSGAPSPPAEADFGRAWRALGGASARGRLHALHPHRAGDIGAQTGFALTALSWIAAAAPVRGARRPLLWVQDQYGRMEAGRPYGLGLERLGIAPADVIVVAVRDTLEALTAAEMGLDAGELQGVLIELPPTLPADMLRLGKRLALRAERARTACFFLHGGTRPAAMPLATRWFVSPAPTPADRPFHMRSRSTLSLTLEKNRFGPTGAWRTVLDPPPASFSNGEWRHDDPTSAHARSPHPVAVAATARDRQGTAAGPLAPAA